MGRLEGALKWQGQVKAAAERWGIDYRLPLAVMAQESGGDQAEISSAGAIGLMQLMPNTAAGLGVDPLDPQQNIDGGVRFLAELSRRYSGDLTKTLSAYNAGPNAVDKYGGIPPFAETQDYVVKVKGYLTNLPVGSPYLTGPAQPTEWSGEFGGSSTYPVVSGALPAELANGAATTGGGSWTDFFTAAFWKKAALWLVMILLGIGVILIGVLAIAKGGNNE